MEPLDEQMLEVAMAAAREAAEIHRKEAGRFRASDWEEKATADFVTLVDLEAEEAIIRRLRDRFPGHEIVAEEAAGGAVRGGHVGRGAVVEPAGHGGGGEEPAGHGEGGEEPAGGAGAAAGEGIRWFVDPLDGTTNWLHGYPEYAVSIGAADERGVRVGVVLNSATGETFHAVRGSGSHRDGEPIRTSEVDELRLALVGTGFPFKRRELLPRYLRMLDAVLRSTSGVRRAGSAALDLCDLACGRLDAFWELWLMPWDVAAGALIVREAGGVFAPLRPCDPPESVAGPEGATPPAGDALPAEDPGSAGGEPGRGEPDAVLARAREAARAFLEEGAPRPPAGTPEPGAYMGANGRLLEALGRVLCAV